MSTESQDYKELSHLIWKEFVSYANDDKVLKELLKRDESYLKYLGKHYVDAIWGDMGGIYECLEDVSDKPRKEVFKILVKEYFRKYKNKLPKTYRINLIGKEWEDIKNAINSK